MKKYLLLMVVCAFVGTACSGNAKKEEKATLKVEGACGMCKKRIETTATAIKGVSFAQWELEKKVIQVTFDPKLTTLAAISKAIAAVGYKTEKDEANPEAYESLPACCKY
jgi:copper chaperone CopZ